MAGRHYLDHASTSPLRREAIDAITTLLHSDRLGNPARPYEEGRAAREVIEQARESVATFFCCRPREVVFTSSGTEAINAATESARRRVGDKALIACAPIEHSAVRLSSERDGPTETLRVDHLGRIDLDHLEALLRRSRPCLVHCQLANHEVGTLQHAAAVVEACRLQSVPVHVDACTAIGQMPLDLSALGADFVSVSAHKFGGPTGIGALVVSNRTRLRPLLVGADEERGRRAGTENLLGIVGFGAVAAKLSLPGVLETESSLARQRTERLVSVATSVDEVVALGDPIERVPHLVCFAVAGVEAEGVVLGLDRAGIAVHSGSACSSEAFEPSPVLEAMGVDAQRSLRLSVGWTTTDDDLEAFGEMFPAVVKELRSLGTSG